MGVFCVPWAVLVAVCPTTAFLCLLPLQITQCTQDGGKGVGVELPGENSNSSKMAREQNTDHHPGASTDRQVCPIKPNGWSHKPESEAVIVIVIAPRIRPLRVVFGLDHLRIFSYSICSSEPQTLILSYSCILLVQLKPLLLYDFSKYHLCAPFGHS